MIITPDILQRQLSKDCLLMNADSQRTSGLPSVKAPSSHFKSLGPSPANLPLLLGEWKPASRSPRTLTTHLAGEQCHGGVQERTGRRRER